MCGSMTVILTEVLQLRKIELRISMMPVIYYRLHIIYQPESVSYTLSNELSVVR